MSLGLSAPGNSGTATVTAGGKATYTTEKVERNGSQKLTIGLDLGDRFSWYCVLDGSAHRRDAARGGSAYRRPSSPIPACTISGQTQSGNIVPALACRGYLTIRVVCVTERFRVRIGPVHAPQRFLGFAH